MTDLPLTQTPATDREFAEEYIRIQCNADKDGYIVSRTKPSRRHGTLTEVLVSICGGNLGKVLALVAAQTAAKTGLIDTIYLDGDV